MLIRTRSRPRSAADIYLEEFDTMAEITAALVMKLRKMSGQGMMDCKKALEETDGNIEEAVALLRKKGLATLEKRAGRETSEGRVVCKKSDDGKTAALATLCCETDFVSRATPLSPPLTSLPSVRSWRTPIKRRSTAEHRVRRPQVFRDSHRHRQQDRREDRGRRLRAVQACRQRRDRHLCTLQQQAWRHGRDRDYQP